jgi:hypothetical protein
MKKGKASPCHDDRLISVNCSGTWLRFSDAPTFPRRCATWRRWRRWGWRCRGASCGMRLTKATSSRTPAISTAACADFLHTARAMVLARKRVAAMIPCRVRAQARDPPAASAVGFWVKPVCMHSHSHYGRRRTDCIYNGRTSLSLRHLCLY